MRFYFLMFVVTLAAVVMVLGAVGLEAQTSPVLSVIERQQGLRLTTQLAGATAAVTARQRDLADAQAKPSAALKKEEIEDLQVRLKAALARQSESQSRLAAFESAILTDHQADANTYRVNWSKGVVEKR